MLLAVLLFSAMGMVSCSEDDGVVDEFANWQQTNETFFTELSAEVKAKLEDPTCTDWKRIKSLTKDQSTEGVDTDYIIVKVIKSAPDTESESPYFNDSVSVHYQGNLLPSASYNVAADPYPIGYRFGASYYGQYDEDVCIPVDFLVGGKDGSGLIDGFSTALQNMRRGDHWVVYIPYQLGYGTAAESSIPAYSTLIFNIWLVDFWR